MVLHNALLKRDWLFGKLNERACVPNNLPLCGDCSEHGEVTWAGFYI